MKSFIRKILGVTLLEVMLVLAIAAMIIVMSVRYYQSATTAQQANTVVETVNAIVAAADSLAQASGSYSVAGVITSTVQQVLPGNSMNTPWGTAITVTGAVGNSFIITIPAVPSNVCPLLVSRLGANSHFTAVTACSGVTTVTTTYQANT